MKISMETVLELNALIGVKNHLISEQAAEIERLRGVIEKALQVRLPLGGMNRVAYRVKLEELGRELKQALQPLTAKGV